MAKWYIYAVTRLLNRVIKGDLQGTCLVQIKNANYSYVIVSTRIKTCVFNNM